MTSARTRVFLPLALLSIGAGLGASARVPGPAVGYVSVVNQDGRPVDGLTTADFFVQANGGQRSVADARKATDPLSIVFVIDESIDAVPYLRQTLQSVGSALRAENPRGRAALVHAAEPPVALMPVADHGTDLAEAIGAVVDGYALMPGIIEAASALQKEETRRRVVFTIDMLGRLGDEAYTQKVANALNRGRASLWGVAVTRRAVTGTPSREAELQDLVATSGGRRERVSDLIGLEPVTSRLVHQILSQYAVTIDDGLLSSGEVRLGVRRAGLTVTSPLWTK